MLTWCSIHHGHHATSEADEELLGNVPWTAAVLKCQVELVVLGQLENAVRTARIRQVLAWRLASAAPAIDIDRDMLLQCINDL